MTAIGIWGCFDLESLGAHLTLRVATAELSRRLPGVAVRAFAPFGSSRPIPLDGGEPVEPLDPPTATHSRALASELDLVVVTGDVALFDPGRLAAAYGVSEETAAAFAHLLTSGPAGVPLALSGISVREDIDDKAERCAHVSVSDLRSQALLPGATLLPHPALLAPRVFAPRVIEKRTSFLRAMGWWPEAATPVVVQGGSADAGRAAEVAAALGDTPVVVIEAEAGDAEFAAALLDHLPGALRLPGIAGVEDRVAAVAGASRVVAASPVLHALATAYGRPRSHLDAPSEPEQPEDRAAGEGALDAEYDALAALVPGAHPAPLVAAEVEALRAALNARGHRLASERVLMADHVLALRADYEGRLANCVAEAEAMERENALLRSRWSIRLRSAAGRALRRVRRSA